MEHINLHIMHNVTKCIHHDELLHKMGSVEGRIMSDGMFTQVSYI